MKSLTMLESTITKGYEPSLDLILKSQINEM